MDLRSNKRRRLEQNDGDSSPADTRTILMLNDDCLYMILSYFNLRQLLAIEEVCPRFKAVAVMIYRTCDVLDFDKLADKGGAFRSTEAEKIARRVGRYAHTLIMSNRSFLFMRRRIPRFIHVHCKNLKSIHLRGFTLRPKSVTNFSKVFTEVKEAQFKDCCFNDVVLLELLRIDQIKVLDVQSNRRIRGTFLAALRNIRGINLSSCKCVDRRLFMKFCEEHRNLRQLVVVDCPWIDVLCLRHIAANLQNLEEIEIINWYNGAMEEDFANLALPKLKYLCIHDIHTLNHYQRAEARMDMLIQRVSTYKRLQWLNIEQIVVTKNIEKALPNFENLKFLRLHKTCKDSTLQMLTCTETLRILEIEKSGVTTHGLVTLIARCSSIRFLIISGCRNIEENFIAQILDHISGRSHMLLIWVDESVFPRQEYEKKYIEINPSKLMLTYEMYPPISPPMVP